MNDLLALNRRFLIRAYLWIAGLLTLAFTVYLFFNIEETPGLWIAIIYSIALIFAPALVIGAWVYDWYRKRRNKEKILQLFPYKVLNRIGFKNRAIIVNHNGLKDYTPTAWLNEYQIFFDIDHRKPRVVEFMLIGVNGASISKEFLKKARAYHRQGIDFRRSSITLKIHTKKTPLHALRDLENILEHLTDIVYKEGFQSVPVKAIH